MRDIETTVYNECYEIFHYSYLITFHVIESETHEARSWVVLLVFAKKEKQS